MKKTLIAAAALAVAGVASAQVTLSGTVGMGYQSSTAGVAGMTNTDMNFTLSASEDLGGGLKASAAAAYDTTGSTFGSNVLRRNTSVSLGGGFGTISLANTRSGSALTSAMVAPTSLPDGMFDSSGIVTRAAVDVFQFTGPNMGVLTPWLVYAEAGADGNGASTVKTTQLGANFASGAIAGQVSFKRQTGAGVGAVTSFTEGFVTYDAGVAKFGIAADTKTNGDGGVLTAANAAKGAVSMGVSAPLGAITLGANYAKRGEAKVTEWVVKYDLSKRTAVRFSSGNQTVDAESQYRLNVVHTF